VLPAHKRRKLSLTRKPQGELAIKAKLAMSLAAQSRQDQEEN
jgi:hypothetical protein